jgi:hypothetical protein
VSHRPVPRMPALLVIVAALVAGGLIDRRARPSAAAAAPSGLSIMEAAAPDNAQSSSWYCAGATDVPGGPANGSLVLANSRSQPVRATVEVLGQSPQGSIGTVPVTVPANGVTQLPYQQVGQTGWVGAIVQVDGGGVAVGQQIGGPLGVDASPCASAASTQWYFPSGSTGKDNNLIVALLNPFPDDAIADMSFVTEGGVETPDDFQGLVVPGHSLTAIDIGSHVRRRDRVSTSITVRRGRLVAERLQLWAAAGTPPGLALDAGAPSASKQWTFADGLVDNNLHEWVDLLNPSSKEAQVEVSMALDQGSAEPFTITVPPQGTATLDVNPEARIPRGVGHAIAVRSLNGVAVAAERRLAAANSVNPGSSSTQGAAASARRWIVPVAVSPKQVGLLVIANLSPKAVHVTIRTLDGSAAPAPVDLQPGGRVQLRSGPVEVDASGDVVVEHFLFNVSGSGQSAAVGIPLR